MPLQVRGAARQGQNQLMDPLHGFPPAPAWSITVGDIGRASIFAAGIGYILCLLLSLIPQAPRRLVAGLFILSGILIAVTMGSLVTLFVNNQFQYLYVWQHGDTLTSLAYKISGTWSAQQGSFLLWALCIAITSGLGLISAGPLQRWYIAACSLVLATLCGILVYETPFGIMKEIVKDGQAMVPPRGNGLTPSLQNYWMVIHPPTIFLGFGMLTVIFAYAVAALLHNDSGEWVKRVRGWTIAAMSILGLGLCMGGFWAYETQGWGGFWAWDPVENTSFVPWLITVALLHGIIVQVARGRWVLANFILAGLSFIAFVYGTFLTRSGLLDNVSNHSFASMDKSALAILRGFLIAVSVGFAALVAWRGPALARAARNAQPDAPGLHREGFYRLGMVLIFLLAVVVTLGMSWPVITALRGGEGKRVEEGLYHLVVVWFFLPCMMLMGLTPFVSWRSMGARALMNRVLNIVSLAVFLTGITFVAIRDQSWGTFASGSATVAGPTGSRLPLLPVMAILLFACYLVAVSAAWRAIELARTAKMSVGGFVAHLGLAVLMAGLILSRGFERKEQQIVAQGGSVGIMGYNLAYDDMVAKDLYDRDGKVIFTLTDPQGNQTKLEPGLYYYEQGEELKTQVWPYVKHEGGHDIYLSLYPPVTDVWEEPQRFRIGEMRTIDGVVVTYKQPTMTGTPGTAGATFGGVFEIKTRTGTYTVNPTLQLAEGGVQPSFTPVGEDFFAILSGMDAKDRSVSLRLMFARPLYPVELFYKPMTALVWVGTGILFLGGAMSAFARRFRSRRAPAPVSAPISVPVTSPEVVV